MVARSMWQDFTGQIMATEVAVSRVLAGKKGRKRIPTYDEVVARQRGEQEPLPDWMAEFEKANKGRLAGDWRAQK